MFSFKHPVRIIRWHSRLERQSSKREVVGSSPAVGKIFFILLFSLSSGG